MKKTDPNLILSIINLRKKNKSLKEIAKKVGCSLVTVHKYIYQSVEKGQLDSSLLDIRHNYTGPNITEKQRKIMISKSRKSFLDKLMESEFNSLSDRRKKKRIIIEQDNKCNHCKRSKWNKKPIALELEHKDGNRNNNLRENLEVLCPNCHAQTSTWRGRNIRLITSEVKDRISQELILNKGNIKEALNKEGLEIQGNNYRVCQKILTRLLLEGKL